MILPTKMIFTNYNRLLFSDWLRNGEEFALISYDDEQEYQPYQLRVRLIEADRVSTPGSLNGDYFTDKKLKNGNRIVNGVEITDSGKVVAYHICSRFQMTMMQHRQNGYVLLNVAKKQAI